MYMVCTREVDSSKIMDILYQLCRTSDREARGIFSINLPFARATDGSEHDSVGRIRIEKLYRFSPLAEGLFAVQSLVTIPFLTK